MLGVRNHAIYGKKTLAEIVRGLEKTAEHLNCEIASFQSNNEGELITWIQNAAHNKYDGIIFNPGGYTHTSVALRDAVEIARDLGVPTIEVHLSDIAKREHFRRTSLLSEEPSVVVKTIKGEGPLGYQLALEFLVNHIRNAPKI